MDFGLKESTKVEDCEKANTTLINSLFQAIKEVNKSTSLRYFRPGKWTKNELRPIKMIFKNLMEKKYLFPLSIN